MKKNLINKDKNIINFLYEIGTLRKISRMHRQVLLSDDLSDNIATHTFRVAIIGWFLAIEEGADPYKTVMMCLLHDVPETRSNDHNWIHKKYVKVFEEEIIQEQFQNLPFLQLLNFINEYEKRNSLESTLCKEADTLDQIMLLREYEWSGNKEANLWLYGNDKKREFIQLKKIKTQTGMKFGNMIYKLNPSDWWNHIWTSKNR